MDSPPTPAGPGGPTTPAPSRDNITAGTRHPGRTIVQTTACPPAMQRNNVPWCFSDFAVQRMLGEGQMSSVVQCICSQSKLPVAIKMYHKDRMNSLNIKQVAREIEIHASLQHPNIIQLYGAFEDKDGIYLVMEFAAKGDLFGELSRKGGYMHEGYVVKHVLHQFLLALSYLHEMGVLHRDIKPENVLLGEEGQIRVGDFGLAINLVKERPVSRVGTLDYMPPEIVRLPQPSQTVPYGPEAEKPPSYGLAVDVWCVGILAYELLIGGPPFETDTREETYKRILKMQPYLPKHLTGPAKDFLCDCLRKEPSERPTVQQLQGHPWLKMYQGTTNSPPSFGRLPPSNIPLFSPRGSPTVVPASPPVRGASSDTVKVVPSHASAPCLSTAARSLSFGPLSGRHTPKTPPATWQLAGAAAAGAELHDRCPRVNSFASNAGSLQSYSPGPKSGLGPASPKAAGQAAATSHSSPSIATGGTGPAGGGSGWVEIDMTSKRSADGEGTIPAGAPHSGCYQTGATSGGKASKQGSDGTGRVVIKVEATPGDGALPAGASTCEGRSLPRHLDSHNDLIPASHGPQASMPDGAPSEGDPTAAGAPAARKGFSAFKSRLGTLKLLLPTSGSSGQGLKESVAACPAGRQSGADGLQAMAVHALTDPAIAHMLAPAPGDQTIGPAPSKFESLLCTLGLGKRRTGSSNAVECEGSMHGVQAGGTGSAQSE